jgi:hypothetical protein
MIKTQGAAFARIPFDSVGQKAKGGGVRAILLGLGFLLLQRTQDMEGRRLPPLQGGYLGVANPGQRSFLAQPWAFMLHAVGVDTRGFDCPQFHERLCIHILGL